MMTQVSKLSSHQNVKCHFCDKVFCCESCRDKHELNKHGRLEQKCPLCYNDKVQIKSFDNSKLLNHLVEHHFPLCCNLCGQVFRKASDLQMFQQCRWKCSPAEKKQQEKSSVEKEPSQALYTPSPITRHLHYNSNSEVTKSFSEGFIKMNDPTEVPKINRYTSTPLQGSVSHQKLNNLAKMITKDFNFLMKTPQTPRCISTINTSDVDALNSETESMKQNLESQYFSDPGDNENRNDDSASTSSITSTSLANNKSMWKSCKDYSKIDLNSECESCKENENDEINDEHSVQDSEGQEAVPHVFERATEESSENGQNKEQATEDSFENEQSNETPNSDESSAVDSKSENAENKISNEKALEKKTMDGESKTDSEASKSESVKKDAPVTFTSKEFITGESTRMIMMVVVEKSSNEFSSADFRPILESGLKKLEQAVSVKDETNGSAAVDNFRALTPMRNIRDREQPETVISAVEEFRNNFRALTPIKKIRPGEEPETVLSAVKEFSYVRVSGTTYSTPIKQEKKSTVAIEKKENIPETHYGFMSSMTRALMNVFRKIPDKMSLSSLSRQPNLPAIAPAPLSEENRQIEYSSPVRPSSRKRRRDEMESPPKRADSPAILTAETPAKKYRGGWYKIKARPPIRQSSAYDQMRVSATTQRFQQGLLSSGNTVIPIPSRAQTDNEK